MDDWLRVVGSDVVLWGWGVFGVVVLRRMSCVFVCDVDVR